MTEPKFSPGSWRADGETINAIKGKVVYVVGYSTSDIYISRETAAANALVMAASTDLYAALEDCLREHGGFTIKGRCAARAKAALAKARGE